MSELIISHGQVPAGHLRSFGHVMGYEAPVIVSAEGIEQDIPSIWERFRLPDNRPVVYGDDLALSNKYNQEKSEVLADYLQDHGYDGSGPLAILARLNPTGQHVVVPMGRMYGGEFLHHKTEIEPYEYESSPDFHQLFGVTQYLGPDGVHSGVSGGYNRIERRLWHYRSPEGGEAVASTTLEHPSKRQIIFGRHVVMQVTATERLRNEFDASGHKLISRVVTHEAARYVPVLTPEQEARLAEITAEQNAEQREAYNNDPFMYEMGTGDNLSYMYETARKQVYKEIG